MTATDTARGTDLDTLAVDTVRPWPWTPSRRPATATWARPWPSARRPTCCGTRFLSFDPERLDWFDRDRFVLSNGHASVLQYIALHLTGYAIGIDDLKQQRQWGSITPGHPEHFLALSIEVTTGPLARVGNAVGFAIAERFLADRYNRAGHQVVDHRTWAFCSDGDMMEGSKARRLGCRYLRLGQADPAVRRQPHHHRRPHRDHLRRGRRGRLPPGRPGHPGRRDANDIDACRAIRVSTSPDCPTFIRLRSHIAWGAQRPGHPPSPRGRPGRGRGQGDQAGLRLDPDKHFFA